MSASANDDSEKHKDAKASAQDGEGGEDDRLSQGEDKVDKTEEEATSEAPRRQKTGWPSRTRRNTFWQWEIGQGWGPYGKQTKFT